MKIGQVYCLLILDVNFLAFPNLKIVQAPISGQRTGSTPNYFNLYLSPIPGISRYGWAPLFLLLSLSLFNLALLLGWAQLSFYNKSGFQNEEVKESFQIYQTTKFSVVKDELNYLVIISNPICVLLVDVQEGKICLLSEPEFMWKNALCWGESSHVCKFWLLQYVHNYRGYEEENQFFLAWCFGDKQRTKWGRKEKEKKRKDWWSAVSVGLDFWPQSAKN